MPRGACSLLRGLTNRPQRLLAAAYVATAASPTPCRATTIQNGPQAMQQAPTVKTTAGAPVCTTELAHRSIQLCVWSIALSQLFSFAPGE